MNPPTCEKTFRDRAPYKDAFDIDYPQEDVPGRKDTYCCRFCKKLTTDINGRLENHAADCEYRLAKEKR